MRTWKGGIIWSRPPWEEQWLTQPTRGKLPGKKPRIWMPWPLLSSSGLRQGLPIGQTQLESKGKRSKSMKFSPLAERNVEKGEEGISGANGRCPGFTWQEVLRKNYPTCLPPPTSTSQRKAIWGWKSKRMCPKIRFGVLINILDLPNFSIKTVLITEIDVRVAGKFKVLSEFSSQSRERWTCPSSPPQHTHTLLYIYAKEQWGQK